MNIGRFSKTACQFRAMLPADGGRGAGGRGVGVVEQGLASDAAGSLTVSQRQAAVHVRGTKRRWRKERESRERERELRMHYSKDRTAASQEIYFKNTH